jgi:hypothetical protein
VKTYLAVVARIILTHVIDTPAQRYMTVAQAKAELREAGVPESALKHMPTLNRQDVDPDESPYDDPEVDDEGLVDGPIADTPAKIPKEGRPGPGRPRGSKNKISRTMREALAAAAEELGRTDLDKWEEVVQKAADHPDPYKRFFMVAAVKEVKTYLAVVARIIPTHVIDTPAQRYMTVAQAKAELREAGVPESVIKHMPTLNRRDVDPDEIVGRRPSPYDDPETDDEGLVDVTPPKSEAAE